MAAISVASAERIPPGTRFSPWQTAMFRFLPMSNFDSLQFVVDQQSKHGRFTCVDSGKLATRVYIVTDPELVREMLVEKQDKFHKAKLLRDATGLFLGNGLLTSEGDFWKRQRKLAQPAFHFQRIEAYGKTMADETLKLIGTWHDNETRDIAHDMMKLTLYIVCRTLFSTDMSAKADRVGELMHDILEGAQAVISQSESWLELLTHRRHNRMAAASRELQALIDDIIRNHKARNADTGDLLSMLIEARDDGDKPMSDEQLRDEVITLFTAGHETTANTVTWTLYLLSQHPEIEAKVMAELTSITQSQTPPTVRDLQGLPYLEQVVKESMRLYPPAGGVTRAPIEDIVLGGYVVPAGVSIAVSSYAMHRDPEFFTDPLKFNPERFSPERESQIPKYAYLPFGAGPRVCIGNVFALMESRILLATILQRWKLSLAPNQKVMAEQLFTIRPKFGMKMIASAR